MGRLRLVGRLVARDLRRRPGQAVLMLLAVTAATATLTLVGGEGRGSFGCSSAPQPSAAMRAALASLVSSKNTLAGSIRPAP